MCVTTGLGPGPGFENNSTKNAGRTCPATGQRSACVRLQSSEQELPLLVFRTQSNSMMKWRGVSQLRSHLRVHGVNPKTVGLQCSKRLRHDKSCCLQGCTPVYLTFRRSKLPPSSRPKTLLPYRRRNLFLRNVGPEPTTCTLTRNKTAAFIHRCVNLKPRNSVTKYLFLTSGPFLCTERCPRTDFFFRYYGPVGK